MRIVFMGTSDFAVPSLEKLIKNDFDIVGVVTQPDRPKGRGKKVMPTPIKEVALANNLTIIQPNRIRDVDAINQVLAWEPDLVIVVSYGQIIPKEILDYPRYGCINLHASLLPEYRGAAPIQRAIMDGKKVSGVTTMFMEEGLDTGDIIMQIPVPIDEDMDHGSYEKLLASKGAGLLVDTIRAIQSGSMPRKKQDDSKATYAHMITSEDEKIDWNNSAVDINNQIRGLCPTPGAFTTINGEKIKIYKTKVIDEEQTGIAGTVLEINKDGFIVQTQKGLILVQEVQRPGKKRMSAFSFLQGFTLTEGTILNS
ncbi:MAG: methionyl-tRNA formyltransferase [Syntrophomonadaceae bacterium]|nr:methionyl-tRNA formyltransferase [Syntrophomonadaceae bacterium]